MKNKKVVFLILSFFVLTFFLSFGNVKAAGTTVDGNSCDTDTDCQSNNCSMTGTDYSAEFGTGTCRTVGYNSGATTTLTSVVGSQCTGTSGTGCDVNQDKDAILDQCKKSYADASCASVKDYVDTLSAVCKNDSSAEGKVDCDKIAVGGIYGPEAAKYAALSAGDTPGGATPAVGDTPGGAAPPSALDGKGIYIPTNTGLADSNIKDILTNLLRWLLGIVGVIALIGFAISGIQYIVASGDEGIMETAKKNMLYSIIGIVVVLASFVIIQAIDFALRAKSF
ncbi:MAG: pilin [Parcubacteria group bacterium]|jgi:hypothetical protein